MNVIKPKVVAAVRPLGFVKLLNFLILIAQIVGHNVILKYPLLPNFPAECDKYHENESA